MSIKKHVLAVIFILVFFPFNTYAEEVWKIASLDWQPYSGSELTNKGNSIQKLEEVLKKENIRLIVEFYPWKRAQKKAKTKEFVGYFPAWLEEVTEGFVGSAAVDWSWIGILKESGKNLKFKTIDDLFKNYKVGIVKTYVYPAIIADAIKKYPQNVDGSPSETSLLKKLAKSRIDVAITDPDVMMYLAEKEGLSNIEPVKNVIKKELVLAFSDDEENVARIKLLEKLLQKK